MAGDPEAVGEVTGRTPACLSGRGTHSTPDELHSERQAIIRMGIRRYRNELRPMVVFRRPRDGHTFPSTPSTTQHPRT